jgi:hypothetical protein
MVFGTDTVAHDGGAESFICHSTGGNTTDQFSYITLRNVGWGSGMQGSAGVSNTVIVDSDIGSSMPSGSLVGGIGIGSNASSGKSGTLTFRRSRFGKTPDLFCATAILDECYIKDTIDRSAGGVNPQNLNATTATITNCTIDARSAKGSFTAGTTNKGCLWQVSGTTTLNYYNNVYLASTDTTATNAVGVIGGLCTSDTLGTISGNAYLGTSSQRMWIINTVDTSRTSSNQSSKTFTTWQSASSKDASATFSGTSGTAGLYTTTGSLNITVATASVDTNLRPTYLSPLVGLTAVQSMVVDLDKNVVENATTPGCRQPSYQPGSRFVAGFAVTTGNIYLGLGLG